METLYTHAARNEMIGAYPPPLLEAFYTMNAFNIILTMFQ